MIDLWMPGTQARCAFVGMTGRWIPGTRILAYSRRDDKKGGALKT